MRKYSTTLLSLILIFITLSFNSTAQTTGPESGTLLIIGGNADDKIFIPMFLRERHPGQKQRNETKHSQT